MAETNAVAANLVMMEIEDLRRRRTEIAEEARIKNACLAKDVEKIRKLLLHGKATTGDAITDYFIGAYGIIDDAEVSKPFRDLTQKMAGKTGELFLVVRRTRERHAFGGPGQGYGETDFHLETRYHLGVLSDESLVLDLKKPAYGLPAEEFGELSVNIPFRKRTGPHLFTCLDGQLQDLGKTVGAGYHSGAALEVLIGDAAVFGHSPFQFGGRPTKRPREWVVVLNSAARMLGKNVPEAPEEKAARADEQREVLSQLEGQHELRKRILGGKPVSQTELNKCEERIRALLARTEELQVANEPEALLAAKGLKGTP